MANLPETEDFADGTYQIETSDRVLGGPGGIANKQAEQLGNRTAWLRAAITKIINGTTAVGKATQLAAARTLRFKGAVSGSGSYDGTGDTEIALTLVDTGVAAGTYTKVTINVKGLVTGASNPTTLAGYGITDAFTKPETTSAIQQAISNLVASSPAALDTLNELAAALGNDPNFATTVTNALAGKASKATTLGGYGITDAFTRVETTSAIQQAVAALVASSPAGLDTLKELATALGNDPNFATTMTNALAGKASKATTLGGYGITDAFTKPEATSAIQQAVAALVASSPAALDTLNELAAALGNDPNFATTVTNALAEKASKATTLGGYGITDAYSKTQTYSRTEVTALLVQATESVQGMAKVGTQVQVDAGNDDSVMVTPKKMRGAKASCSAWVCWNGTGTVTVRDSYNVSSITDNGTGDFTVNFATPMANANYSFSYTVGGANIMNMTSGGSTTPPSVSGLRVTSVSAGGAGTGANFQLFDFPFNSVQIFGGK